MLKTAYKDISHSPLFSLAACFQTNLEASCNKSKMKKGLEIEIPGFLCQLWYLTSYVEEVI